MDMEKERRNTITEKGFTRLRGTGLETEMVISRG